MKVYFPFIVVLQLLVFFPATSYGLRLYTQDEYQDARDKAVRTAREGDYKSALVSLGRLLKLEPDNHGALNDYITILIWDEQYKKALAFVSKLDLHELPEYVLRSLIIAADKEDQSGISDKLVAAYFSRYPVVPKNTPAGIEGKSAYEMAQLTFRVGMPLTSLSILKVLHETDPQNQKILAEYIAVLSKEKQYKEALDLLPQLDFLTAPEFAFDALIKSARKLGQVEVEAKLLGHLSRTNYSLRRYAQEGYGAVNKENHETTLQSLARLLQLEPDNHVAFNEYITLLVWNKQFEKALELVPRLDLHETPEYVLRSLVIAAEKEKREDISEQLIALYFNRYPVVPVNTPDQIKGKTARELVLDLNRRVMPQTSREVLKFLYKKDPQNQTVLADYVAALSKNRQHAEALALLPQLDLASAPEFAFDALIESAEQLGKAEIEAKILAVYRQRFSAPSDAANPVVPLPGKKIVQKSKKVTAQKGSNTERPTVTSPYTTRINQAQMYLREQDYEKAEAIVLPLYHAGVKEKSLLHTLSQLFDVQKKYMEAAYVYQQLLELEPGNAGVRRLLVLNLFYAGAPFRALTYLHKKPSLLSTAETNKIFIDTLAFALRWSQYTQPPGTNRMDELDKILIEIERSIQKMQEQDDNYNLTRLQMDYIVALRERGHSEEVIRQYNMLLSQGKTVPDYVLREVASAYLDQQQPEHGRDLYLQLLKKDPHSFELKQALFYAYFDNGEYQKGLDLVTELETATPVWRKDHTGDIVKDNNEKLQASILMANGLAYCDDLTAAQGHYKKMVAIAPYNPELRDNLANVYRWRGWPQKAYEEIAIGRTMEPDNLYLGISNGRALMELYRFREAEEQLARINEQAPENRQVQRLQEDWQLREKRQFLIWVDSGNSDADASDQGSSDFTVESYLYDKFYHYNFRPFVHQYFTKSDFTEGSGRYERIGVGTEYKRNRNSFGVELNSSYSGSSDAGFSFYSEHDLTDQLHLSLGYDSFSTNIPVRAYFHDIRGPGYKVGAVYRLHESTAFTGNYEYLDFSDSNERNGWSVSMQQRIMNLPRFKMILVPSFYQSTNSRIDAPYFNPEEDQSVNLSIQNEWLTYQHYDKSFKQILEVSVGRYYQKNYGTDAIAALVYQHQWVIDKHLNFTYGVKLSHNYYDGEKEKRLAGFASLGWIF